MRVGRQLIAVVTAAIAVAALTGCVPETSKPVATPSASASPVFASDAEALAAAEKAYAAYLKVSDEIANDGGANPERLSLVAVGQLRADDLAGFEEFRKNGWHSSGFSKVKNTQLQSADVDSSANTSQAVAIYICEDISGVDVIDSSGTSIVAPTRPSTQGFQVTFDLVSRHLLPSEREPWQGTNLCEG